MLFLRAVLMLLLYDLLNLVCRFRTLHAIVKSWKINGKANEADVINKCCRAVNRACAWYPKQALCLQRSFVTTYLLRQHGIQASMVLGAQKMPFKAHAWVEVDGVPINERSEVQATYAVWERC